MSAADPTDLEVLGRREAIRRTALLMGGAVTASAVAGVMSGCVSDAMAQTGRSKALSAAQLEMVATIADHIVPPTDTPGARAAGVHRFIDVMLAEYYSVAERGAFLSGLADIDQRAQQAYRRSFVRSTKAQQRALLEELDREAFPALLAKAATAGEASRETERGGGGMTQTAAADTASREAGKAPRPFMRTMKELTVLGYYTSKIGATQELKYVQVPGRFDGCVPFLSVGRAWA